MKRHSLAALPLAGLVLAACNTATDPATADREACNSLLAGDTEIEGDLASYGSSIEGYCDCYVAMLAEEGERTQAATRATVGTIVSIREDRNVGLEAAAEQLEEYVEGRDTSETVDITGEDLDIAGQFVDDVRRDLRGNEGQCPVSRD